eukprot:TRINITY_DN249_c0_g2_i1.p1 TRINITY_DN249_c0_g2~~TRINITY_DN249_c0_g2_i1.p1  ORF type:complete len:195 (+),score=26.52 TRINITY_DN249_c0_g2_i1:629-1213(+)
MLRSSGMLRKPSVRRPTIQNVVATVSVGQTIDLRLIQEKARNAEYNPKRFAAVIIRLKELKTTALVFQSGKIVCTGAKTVDQARLASQEYVRTVQRAGYRCEMHDFTVQNLVGTCEVGFEVDLYKVYDNPEARKYCKYDPEVFPGLVFRLISPRVALLVFASGKVVITGAKSAHDMDKAFDNISNVLRNARREM